MNIDREAPIGVFDSGVGGLTVAREIMRNLPSEKIVYFGDTARVPYGSNRKRQLSGTPGRSSVFCRNSRSRQSSLPVTRQVHLHWMQ